ncbi:hypothetical protein C5167_011236 [Papaver somniferum]|uniref:FRIGIDA-like protein n=1 Tax=Papaver somniferum TaxID=3469 RepID=A0A4Y7K3Z1_PAPSO|nr:FRIGIDA-like protein 3 [Papaver somniferum]XP_026394947.1 FRIGIDA-like protein 3 [Papaver somniferum]XP_026394948.1 FRIGIDA-like protein 3 [Papaver somniferum]RZC67546.1 hypothetical protein C5167_011236 [Papaver somniferum]
MVECQPGQPNSTYPPVEVCQKCGVTGYANLLIYCDVCRVSAEHLYCLDRVSEVTQEVVEWSCEQCVPTYFYNQLQPSIIVEERNVKQLPDERCVGDASEEILPNRPLISNENAYELPITDHVRSVENLLQKSQLNLQTSTAEAEAATSDGKQSASWKLDKTLVEQEAQQDVPENSIPYEDNTDYFETKMKCLKDRFNRLNNRSNRLEEIEKAFLEKKSEMCTLIANRAETVDVKEQAMIDRVQELKDMAVVAIKEAQSKSNEHTVVVFDIQKRLELRQFCKEMDSKGLLNYIMKYEKYMDAIREEMPSALKNVAEPALFVLDFLKRFYPCHSQTTLCPKGSTNDAIELMSMRKSCLMVIESLALVLGADDLMDRITKWQAKTIADSWKSRLDSRDAAIDYNSTDEEAFLKLITTFRITSEFNDEELCKLVLAVSHRRQAPSLCRSLGLKHRIPGIIEVLIRKGRRIDAVHFVLAFKLTEKYPPVLLLKTYLKDLRKDLLSKMNSSGGDDKIKSDLHVKELAGIKTVIECIEEYKLQKHYKLDPLLKRMVQLEQWKSNKKRMADNAVTNQQRKRAREDNGMKYEPNVPADPGSSPLVYNNRSSELHERYRSELSSSYHSLFYP